MPEFILDTTGTVGTGLGHGGTLTWDQISEFNRGFIEALFFTNTGNFTKDEFALPETQEAIREGQSDGELPSDSCFGDIEPRALARIWKICHDFKREAASLLDEAKQLEPGSDQFRYGREALDDRRLGQLFFYASQGHGVAFTDDGDAPCLEALQEMARGYPEPCASYGESVHGGFYVFFE